MPRGNNDETERNQRVGSCKSLTFINDSVGIMRICLEIAKEMFYEVESEESEDSG